MARSSSKSNLGGLPELLVAGPERVCSAPRRNCRRTSRQVTESGILNGHDIWPLSLARHDRLVGNGLVGVAGQKGNHPQISDSSLWCKSGFVSEKFWGIHRFCS